MSNPPIRQRYDQSEYVNFAVTEIPCNSDEDRHFCSLSHSGFPELSSFGVFDGHGGSRCSTALSTSLHNLIVEKYREFNDTPPSELECYRGNYDAIMCESIRQSFKNVDLRLRQTTEHGSTAVSLFVLSRLDGTIRVLCPWVGDSRCVLFQVTHEGSMSSIIMSEDHKPTLRREYNRIMQRKSAPWRRLPIEANRNTFKNPDAMDEFIEIEEVDDYIIMIMIIFIVVIIILIIIVIKQYYYCYYYCRDHVLVCIYFP